MRWWAAVFSGLLLLALLAGVWLRWRLVGGEARSPRPGELARAASVAELPRWAVPYGEEPWRKPQVGLSPEAAPANGAIALPARINVGDIVDRVRHAFAGTPPRVRAETYEALVSGGALELSWRRPGDDGQVSPDADTLVRLRTREIRDGETAVYSGMPESGQVVLGNTAQSLVASDVIEHFAAREAGVDVTWVFAERPDGDLTVVLGVEGLAYAGETAAGHHYKDAAGVARVRVGRATLVDAAGRRTEVPARAVEQGLAFTMAAAALARAEFPVALDPLVTAEFGMDEAVAVSGGRLLPAVAAASPSSYLVVWEDTRGGASDIYGTMVGSTGEVSHPYGLPISTAEGSQSQPAVAGIGTTYWVVWTDSRSGASTDIYGRRVSISGTLLGAGDVPITQASGNQSAPAIACASNCGVVWQSAAGTSYDVVAATVSYEGVVQTTDRPIATDPANDTAPRIASNRTRYFVTWLRAAGASHDAYAARMEPDASVSLSEQVFASGVSSRAAIAALATGSGYFVAWQSSGSDIMGRTLSDAGVAGTTVTVSAGSWLETEPSVASVSSQYLVVWQDSRSSNWDIWAQRVDQSGAPLGSPIHVSAASADQRQPQVAAWYSGSTYLVAWDDRRRSASGELYGAAMQLSGTVQHPQGVPVFTNLNEQRFPDVAWNGSSYFVVWQDSRGSSWDVYGVGISPYGAILHPTGVAISAAEKEQVAPAVAAVGPTFLVVWQDWRNSVAEAYAARVSDAFEVLDANGIPTSAAPAHEIDLAGNDTSWLVVWLGRNAGIYGTQVTTAGAVSPPLPSTIEIAPGGSGPSKVQPTAAASPEGGAYIVVWGQYDVAGMNSYDLYGTRVSGGGVVLDAGTSAIPVSVGPGVQLSAAIAARASNEYLVAWGNGDITSRTISTGGTVQLGPETSVAAGGSAQGAPAVAWDGSAYVVAWLELRTSYDVVARYLSADGIMLGNPFDVSADAGEEYYVALASAGTGWTLAAYRSVDTTANGTTERIVGRLLGFDANGDNDGDGYSGLVDDCNDADAAIHPGATEVCDTVDSDCDGSLVDEFANNDGDATPDCIDADDDNDGVADATDNCALLANASQANADADAQGDACDLFPNDPNLYAGAIELCDGRDNNGNGVIDEGTGCEVCP